MLQTYSLLQWPNQIPLKLIWLCYSLPHGNTAPTLFQKNWFDFDLPSITISKLSVYINLIDRPPTKYYYWIQRYIVEIGKQHWIYQYSKAFFAFLLWFLLFTRLSITIKIFCPPSPTKRAKIKVLLICIRESFYYNMHSLLALWLDYTIFSSS